MTESPETSAARIPALDSLRGLAVLAVLAGHVDYFFFGIGFDLFFGGFIGVDLFFVLSGFLITRNLLAECHASGAVNLRRFYLHRALRLLPALGLLLLVLLPWLWWWSGMDRATIAQAAGTIIFYVYNWFIYFTLENVPGTGHLWSLSVEEQFYLVWPFLLLLLLPVGAARLRAWLLICGAVVLLVALLRVTAWQRGDSWLLLYLRTDLRADELMFGAGLAMVETLRSRLWPAPRFAGLVLIAGFLAATILLGSEAPLMYHGGFSALGLLCVLLVWCAAVGGLGAGNAALNSLGRVSYGLYLYHMPIVMALASSAAGAWLPSEWARLCLAVGLSLVAAYLSFHVLEARFLALKQSH